MPAYRIEFFRRLVMRAAQSGLSVDVFAGPPRGSLKQRSDSTESVFTILDAKEINLGKRTLVVKDIRPVLKGRYDLVISEQAVGNIDTYLLALTLRGKFALWGHGGDYVTSPGPVTAAVKRWLTSKASWFFAYTSGGADSITKDGFDSKRITVVNNTFDTDELDTWLASGGASEAVGAPAVAVSTSPGRVLAFIGGVDETKRLDFLLDACSSVVAQMPDVELIICGDGKDLPRLRSSYGDYEWLKFSGRVEARDKAAVLNSARFLVNPGRVGLIAVDSLRSGTPLITTEWRFHAPELEYLVESETVIIAKDSVEGFTDAILAGLSMSERDYERLVQRCLEHGKGLTLDAMVDRFLGGLIERLSS